jgi:hypothetical protein
MTKKTIKIHSQQQLTEKLESSAQQTSKQTKAGDWSANGLAVA